MGHSLETVRRLDTGLKPLENPSPCLQGPRHPAKGRAELAHTLGCWEGAWTGAPGMGGGGRGGGSLPKGNDSQIDF